MSQRSQSYECPPHMMNPQPMGTECKPQGRAYMCDGTIKEVLVSVSVTGLPLFSAEGLPEKL